MTTVYPLLLLVVLFLAYAAWVQYLDTVERRDLYNRLMARSYREYLAGTTPKAPSAVVMPPHAHDVADPDFPYGDDDV